jgi:hypothetical protein
MIQVLDCSRNLGRVLRGDEEGSCGRRGSNGGGRSTYSSRRPDFPSPSSSTRNHLSCHLCFHFYLKERLPNTKTRICRVALFVVSYKALDVAMLAFKCLSKVSVVVEGGSNGWQKHPNYEGEGGVPGREIGRRCEYF